MCRDERLWSVTISLGYDIEVELLDENGLSKSRRRLTATEAYIEHLQSMIESVLRWNEDHDNPLPAELLQELENAEFDAEGNSLSRGWQRR